MKKCIAILLMLAMMLGLCACGNGSENVTPSKPETQYTIKYANGTTEKITYSEIKKVFDSDISQFDAKFKDAYISGEGIVAKVQKPLKEGDHYQHYFYLEDGTAIAFFYYTTTDFNIEVGDKVTFYAGMHLKVSSNDVRVYDKIYCHVSELYGDYYKETSLTIEKSK